MLLKSPVSRNLVLVKSVDKKPGARDKKSESFSLFLRYQLSLNMVKPKGRGEERQKAIVNNSRRFILSLTIASDSILTFICVNHKTQLSVSKACGVERFSESL